MKWIKIFTIFLLVIGVLISDRWLTLYTPGGKASYLIFPFLVLSFSKFKAWKSRSIISLFLPYQIITTLFFILGGLKGFVLYTTLTGTSLIGIAMMNWNFRDIIIKWLQPILLFLTFLVAISYYFGLWESRAIGGTRLSFMKNNENILAQQLCIGLAISLFALFTSKSKKTEILLLLISFLFIPPIFATVSRTGIVLMILTFLTFIYARFKAIGLVGMLFIFIIPVFLSSSPEKLFGNNLVSKFIDRASNTSKDLRLETWSIGWEIASTNFLTGIGLDNFSSADFRAKIDEASGFSQKRFGSVHNSFIDLIWIGGIWLLLAYLAILGNLLLYSFRLMQSASTHTRVTGAMIASFLLGIIMFSMAAQGATDKKTWLLLGLSFIWLEQSKGITTNSVRNQ